MKKSAIQPATAIARQTTVLLAILGSITLASSPALAQSSPTPSPAPTEAQPAAPAAPTQVTVPCRRRLVGNQCLRLRATFFEEERRVRQFRNVDFLEAALDGAGNTINAGIRDPNLINSQTIIDATPDSLPIVATVTDRDPDSPNFLEGSSFVNQSANTNLLLGGVQRDPNNPQRGVLSIRGTVEGRPIGDGFINAPYRASGSARGDVASGVVVITNRNNPREELQIVIPATDVGTSDNRAPITAPGFLSIGRGVDR